MKKNRLLLLLLLIASFALTSCDQLLSNLNFYGPRKRSSQQDSEVLEDSNESFDSSSSKKSSSNKSFSSSKSSEAPKYYTVTLSNSDERAGNIFGDGTYLSGERVVITAEANEYYTFAGWYLPSGSLFSRNNPYSFTITKNLDLVARWNIEESALTKDHKLGIEPVFDWINDTVTYGLYPQTVIHSSELINALDLLDDPINGYYQYQGEYYAKISSANPNRAVSKPTFDDGSSITRDVRYWFKCQPINWKIIACEGDNSYLLLSTTGLDTSGFYNTQENRVINGKTIYQNNYEYSDLRNYITGEFYNMAFGLGDQYIQTVTIDNSASTTDTNDNPYICNDTEDKIFLLSYRDYLNPNYGFDESATNSVTRRCPSTDWARVRDAYYGSFGYNGLIWTRSPLSSGEDIAAIANMVGTLTRYETYKYNALVRPSIVIKLN